MTIPCHWRIPVAALSLAAMAVAGCENLGGKKLNPVAGPPPRRIHDADSSEVKTAQSGTATVDDSGKGAVRPASFSTSDKSLQPGPRGTEQAAVVNGQPIFVDDVIDAMPAEARQQLAAIQRQTTPEEFEVQRRRAVLMYLRPLVERTVLVQALEEKSKPEKMKALKGVLDGQFEKYLKTLIGQMGVATRSELAAKLREQGSSLETLKEAFQMDQMARFYLSETAKEPKKPNRSDLVKYYEEHLADYSFPGQVRWQQITLSHAKYGDAEQARALALELAQRVRGGEDFAALAQEYSTATTASEGGAWDWTRQGSLASQDVEQALFTLPVGTLSEPIAKRDGVELVRVLERKDAGRKPFESVQGEIEAKLTQDARRGVTGGVIKELLERAEVTILIPEETEAAPAH